MFCIEDCKTKFIINIITMYIPSSLFHSIPVIGRANYAFVPMLQRMNAQQIDVRLIHFHCTSLYSKYAIWLRKKCKPKILNEIHSYQLVVI